MENGRDARRKELGTEKILDIFLGPMHALHTVVTLL